MVIPDWQSQLEADDIQKLEAKRTEEDKKRDGITVSQDLLDYSEVYLLQKLIGKNWPAVKPVNRPGFDAAPFLEKDADHAQALPHRAA
ncbi:hypothetical protein [Rhodococcus zopfii]|uniref:hypothetical protein n=1 Tax=Rhodococcus zopfii TaxID=43772 RepID=UPI003527ACDB